MAHTCPSCQQPMADRLRFCPACGTAASPDTSEQASEWTLESDPFSTPFEAEPASTPLLPARRRSPGLRLVLALVLLAGGAAAGYGARALFETTAPEPPAITPLETDTAPTPEPAPGAGDRDLSTTTPSDTESAPPTPDPTDATAPESEPPGTVETATAGDATTGDAHADGTAASSSASPPPPAAAPRADPSTRPPSAAILPTPTPPLTPGQVDGRTGHSEAQPTTVGSRPPPALVTALAGVVIDFSLSRAALRQRAHESVAQASDAATRRAARWHSPLPQRPFELVAGARAAGSAATALRAGDLEATEAALDEARRPHAANDIPALLAIQDDLQTSRDLLDTIARQLRATRCRDARRSLADLTDIAPPLVSTFDRDLSACDRRAERRRAMPPLTLE